MIINKHLCTYTFSFIDTACVKLPAVALDVHYTVKSPYRSFTYFNIMTISSVYIFLELAL
jgi:hypothetical protein